MLIIEKKDILVLGKGTAQELHDTILRREAKYSINFN